MGNGDISLSVFHTSGQWDPFKGRSREWNPVPFASCHGELRPGPERAPQSAPLAPAELNQGTGLELSIASVRQTHSGPYSERCFLNDVVKSI